MTLVKVEAGSFDARAGLIRGPYLAKVDLAWRRLQLGVAPASTLSSAVLEYFKRFKTKAVAHVDLRFYAQALPPELRTWLAAALSDERKAVSTSVRPLRFAQPLECISSPGCVHGIWPCDGCATCTAGNERLALGFRGHTTCFPSPQAQFSGRASDHMLGAPQRSGPDGLAYKSRTIMQMQKSSDWTQGGIRVVLNCLMLEQHLAVPAFTSAAAALEHAHTCMHLYSLWRPTLSACDQRDLGVGEEVIELACGALLSAFFISKDRTYVAQVCRRCCWHLLYVCLLCPPYRLAPTPDPPERPQQAPAY